jgi:hypothetical protein
MRASWAGRGSRPAAWLGYAGQNREKGEGVWRGFFSFFPNLFLNLFKLLNSFQTLFKPKHFKLFSNFQIILKTFETSHEQTINTMQPKDDAQALFASKIIQK